MDQRIFILPPGGDVAVRQRLENEHYIKQKDLLKVEGKIELLTANISVSQGQVKSLVEEEGRTQKAYEKGQSDYEIAKSSEETAEYVVTQVVREQLMEIFENRMNTVQEYDKAVSFISEAIKK